LASLRHRFGAKSDARMRQMSHSLRRCALCPQLIDDVLTVPEQADVWSKVPSGRSLTAADRALLARPDFAMRTGEAGVDAPTPPGADGADGRAVFRGFESVAPLTRCACSWPAWPSGSDFHGRGLG
jgi:hypothetical protein